MYDDSRYPPVAVRREQILAIIEQRGFAKVAQLSAHFGISEVTVRADLDALAETNAVQRVHGGAMAGLRSAGLERPLEQTQRTATEQKGRIARAAAAMVRTGDAVLLDVGSTTTAVARALAAREDLEDVVVVTSALNIALELESVIPRFTVVVTGGTLRPMQHSLVEPYSTLILERVRADIAFVGCNGIDVDAGVTNIALAEADQKRRFLENSGRGVIVADSSKLGMIQRSHVAPLSTVDSLLTGVEAPGPALARLREAGLEVITV